MKIQMLVRMDEPDGDGYGRVGTPVRAFADNDAPYWCGTLTQILHGLSLISKDRHHPDVSTAQSLPEWAHKELKAYSEAGIPDQSELYRVLEAELGDDL